MAYGRGLSTSVVFGLLRATRPHFLWAYLVFSLGGIVIGLIGVGNSLDQRVALFSIATVIVCAIGVHFRDEYADWVDGFDTEHGGAGVIREGIVAPATLQTWGIVLTLVGIAMVATHAFFVPRLLIVALPSIVVLIWPNYLTERITLGHEVVTAFSYWAATLWVYLGQGWTLSLPVLLYSLFAFMIALSFISYQDIGDYAVDKKNGKKTLTARLGVEHIANLSIMVGILRCLSSTGSCSRYRDRASCIRHIRSAPQDAVLRPPH